MIEAIRRGGTLHGQEEASWSMICHLGRKPSKGGRPARERKSVEMAILWGVGKESWEVIFGVSMLTHGAMESIIAEDEMI